MDNLQSVLHMHVPLHNSKGLKLHDILSVDAINT
jgi:hypothetical protein